MISFFSKTPRFIQKYFSNLTWSFADLKNDSKTIYLTFDDGPTPEITEWTLDILKKYNAKATFFCIGKNVKKHPEIFQKIITEGHSFGNHTNNHLNGWKVKTEEYLKNIQLTENIFKPQTTNLFRPPYGKIKPSQAKQLIQKGYKIIMWDVLSVDYDATISEEKCLDNVLKNTKNGSIIVFHDSVKASKNMKYTLPKILTHFSEKGYVFKNIQ